MVDAAQTIRITSAGLMDRDPHWTWDSDGIPGREIVFWVISGGRGTLEAGTDRYDLGRGDCFVSPMRESHHGRHAPDDLLSIPWTVFEILDPEGQPVMPSPLPPRHRRARDLPLLETMLSRAIEAHRHGKAWEAGHWMKALLLEVDNQDAVPPPPAGDPGQRDLVLSLAEEMRRAPRDQYPVAALAYRMHCTPDHCIRLFRRYLGATPREYQVRCRIGEASNLLRFSSHPVSRIADLLGYCDIHQFSRQFKQRTGQSPREFRRS